MMKVGMYWANVKGRFRQNSAAERRIYLAIKYGNRWRTKLILKKLLPENQEVKKNEKIPINEKSNIQNIIDSLMKHPNLHMSGNSKLNK